MTVKVNKIKKQLSSTNKNSIDFKSINTIATGRSTSRNKPQSILKKTSRSGSLKSKSPKGTLFSSGRSSSRSKSRKRFDTIEDKLSKTMALRSPLKLMSDMLSPFREEPLDKIQTLETDISTIKRRI